MSMPVRPRHAAVAAAALCCALSLAACGRSSTSSASPSSSASGGGGAPIKVMQIGTFQSQALALTESKAGADAAVKTLNAAGGVDGHQIQMTYCNDAFDANTGAACARQAVSQGDIAVVGPASAEAPAEIPILAAAGIPWIAGEGAGGPIEATSTDSYPLHGGTQVMEVGMGRLLTNLGDKKIVYIIADAAAAYPAGDAIAQGVKAGGGTSSRVLATIGAPDFSAVASSALAKHPDGIAVASTATDAPRIIQAVRQAGFTGPISSLSTIVSDKSITSLGSAANNVYLTSSLAPVTSTSIPQVAAFLAGMQKYDSSAELDNSSINGWTAVHFLAALVGQIKGSITASSLKGVLDHPTSPITLGTVPAYDGIPSPPPTATFPRVPSFTYYLAKVVGGKPVAQGGPTDPLAAA